MCSFIFGFRYEHDTKETYKITQTLFLTKTNRLVSTKPKE